MANRGKSGHTVDGRRITVEEAIPIASSTRSKSLGSRYYTTDIESGDLGMRCFNCSQPGHLAARCPNPPKPTPCTYCGDITNHLPPNSTSKHPPRCPLLSVCYTCSTPGHEARDCPAGRRGGGQGQEQRRTICTICSGLDHHRTQCRAKAWDAREEGIVCVSCGEEGHGVCDGFGGGRGVYIVTEGAGVATNGNAQGTCGNCGGDEHWGSGCRRVGMDGLGRDPRAIEKAVGEEVVKSST